MLRGGCPLVRREVREGVMAKKPGRPWGISYAHLPKVQLPPAKFDRFARDEVPSNVIDLRDECLKRLGYGVHIFERGEKGHYRRNGEGYWFALARAKVWHAMRTGLLSTGVHPSYPEIARATGCPTHATVYDAIQREAKRQETNNHELSTAAANGGDLP